ncbi:MAG: hypothetical protein LBH61_02390 [Dysgonamonadaceae bacterium]|jgi:hypothetical protein|nr:hypothetical protein [Dysgonamonadaceae bacterium]
MPAKRFPCTHEERLLILRAVIKQEDTVDREEAILTAAERYELLALMSSFENTLTCLRQATDDEHRAGRLYMDLFQTAQLYISHFIQVLNFAVIRNEIKTEVLPAYGLESGDRFAVPDLSTGEAILEWGERLIKAETERIAKGGAPIYSPAISKVIVHYDLFKDAIQSRSIYRKNIKRNREIVDDLATKIDRILWNTWTKVEFQYWKLPEEERLEKFNAYEIKFYDY